jgi:putative transposase
MSIMKKVYKFRIYPAKGEERIMSIVLNTCRALYNDSLFERKEAYERDKVTLNYYDQANELSGAKKDDEYLAGVHSQVLQDVLKRLDKAFQNFSRRVRQGVRPGYPRFKSYDRYDSFTYPQSGYKLEGDNLVLSKIGTVKIKQHRPIPKDAIVKTCAIKREADQWYAIFTVELQNTLPQEKAVITSPVGIDLGIKELITLSTSEKVHNPKWLRASEHKLAKEQRRLSKRRKGSANRKKQKREVQKVHRKICNQRKDFHHKLSNELVRDYDLIVFEDLKIRNMVRNRYLAKSISDAGWGQLVSFITYKAAEAGTVVELINPKGTSQRCSSCGEVVPKTLAVRVHKCPHCGLVMDRDENAAINILNRGLDKVGQGLPEYTPVETFSGRSMNQEAIQLVG